MFCFFNYRDINTSNIHNWKCIVPGKCKRKRVLWPKKLSTYIQVTSRNLVKFITYKNYVNFLKIENCHGGESDHMI